MLRLVWRADALGDLHRIIEYIADRNILAADRLQHAIERAAEALPTHPYMHRPGRVAGTREVVVHPNYILIYRVGTDRIDVLAVVHARQQYP